MKTDRYPSNLIKRLLLAASLAFIIQFVSATLYNNTNFIGIDLIENEDVFTNSYHIENYTDHAIVDQSGKIHIVNVDNNKLYCFTSEDDGKTWSKQQLVTGNEGKVITALIGLTQAGKRVVVYTVNTALTNADVHQWTGSCKNTFGVVETDQGWQISNVEIHASDENCAPLGLFSVKAGIVHSLQQSSAWYCLTTKTVYEEVVHNKRDKNNISKIEILYPKSSDNYLYITPPEKIDNYKVAVYNELGSKVKEVDLSISLYIKISDLPHGLYSIKSASNDEVIGKFVKR